MTALHFTHLLATRRATTTMFIGHLPAGYIVSRHLLPRLHGGTNARAVIAAGMLGAIAPDFDLFYFFLIDQQRHHHHTYWTHLPIFWVPLCATSFTALWLRPSSTIAAVAAVFTLNGFGHLLLDSIVGDIWWLAPIVDRPYSLFHVRRVYEPWWVNFVVNPSFLLEIGAVLYAQALWRRGD
jgi:hypothetical protein